MRHKLSFWLSFWEEKKIHKKRKKEGETYPRPLASIDSGVFPRNVIPNTASELGQYPPVISSRVAYASVVVDLSRGKANSVGV